MTLAVFVNPYSLNTKYWELRCLRQSMQQRSPDYMPSFLGHPEIAYSKNSFTTSKEFVSTQGQSEKTTHQLTFLRTFMAQIFPESAPVLFLTKKTWAITSPHGVRLLINSSAHLSIPSLPQDFEEVEALRAYLLRGSVHRLRSDGVGFHLFPMREKGRWGGRVGRKGGWGQ